MGWPNPPLRHVVTTQLEPPIVSAPAGPYNRFRSVAANRDDSMPVALAAWPLGHLHAEKELSMAKTHRKIKKANHGRRPASAKARRAKRRHIRT